MAMSRHISEIATALIQTAHGEACVPEVMANLAVLREVFHERPEVLSQLYERSVDIKKREQALRAALENVVHPYFMNALLSLQQADVLDQFSDFVLVMIAVAREVAGHHEVRVRSAVPLQDNEREELMAAVRQRFGGTQRLDEKVEAELLGGLVVEAGDWHVDASLKGKLERLQHALYV